MTTSKLTKSQKKKYTKKIKYDGVPCRIDVILRYDDECGNGYNSFSITGQIISDRGRYIAGGCIHNEIVKHFPEFKNLIKWHLMSSDEPLHYIANTIYHAKDREYIDMEIGAPIDFKKVLRFKDTPLTFNFKNSFYNFISSVENWDDVNIVTLEHNTKSGYQFESSYTFEGTGSTEWYQGEFKTLQEAQEWLEVFKTFEFEIISLPTKWNKEITPNIEAAKNCAIWGATELDTDETKLSNKEFLLERLPLLVAEFKRTMESIGFTY